jgi:glycosyltransferase involved in cell wall biosynthesis
LVVALVSDMVVAAPRTQRQRCRSAEVAAPPLRILFFAWNYFPAPAGGAERQARLQAEELVKRGHTVHVVCPRTPGIPSGDVNGVRVSRLYRVERRPFQRISYLVSIAWYAARHMRSYDLVHVHLANLQADVVVCLAKLLRRPTYVKVACGGRAGEIARLARVARVTRWVGLRGASVVQALSKEIVDELDSIDVDRSRVVEIPNGYASEFSPVSATQRRALRRQIGLPEDDLLLLYAGRFAEYKGLYDLLAAWRAHRFSGATLVLVGAGDTDKPIEPIEEEPGLIIRPWTNEVLPYLRAADVFVYPSHADGMSNALLEAMACGCVPIATNSGATAEMLVDGDSACLVEPARPDQLQAAIARVLNDEWLRERLALAARDRAESYSIEAVVDAIELQYRRMVG